MKADKKELLVVGIIAIAFLVTGILGRVPTPKATAKAPTTRYHGYELNRAAIHKAKEWTVLISAEGFGGIERGSGVLIDSMTVLTCAHVAQSDNEELWVVTYPGNYLYHAKVGRIDIGNDLATLKLDRSVETRNFPVFQAMHYDGEPITIIGNILGSMKWFVGYGIISGENTRDLYTDGLVLGGDSGGPWINEKGEVVALSDWGLQGKNGPIGISGGISGHVIQKFLKSLKEPSILDILMMGLGS